MARRRCIRREPIPVRWGGGHLCSGVCGRPHLHGRAWSWWRCPVCARADSTRELNAARRRMLDLYYPEPT